MLCKVVSDVMKTIWFSLSYSEYKNEESSHIVTPRELCNSFWKVFCQMRLRSVVSLAYEWISHRVREIIN